MAEEARGTTGGAPGPGAAPAIRLLAPGSSVGTRYELRGVLGRGGSAVVYSAYDRELRRVIALKVLRADRMSEGALKRFRREVAIARDADSPLLVRVYDIGQTPDAVFLTMEEVPGESLHDLLSRGPVGVAEAVRIGAGVLRALDVLHGLGIVHRDVKPGNVLLTESGGVKLGDFGLARHWETNETRLTEHEGLVGTIDYLSPEQALGGKVDTRSDLYSAGALLFEMLTGRSPFAGETALGGLVARLKTAAPDVRSLRPSLPPWVAGVVARLLERDPSRRYASAADALADLESERGPRRRLLERRAVRVGLAAASAAAVAGLALAAWRLGAAPKFERLEPRGETGGIRAVDRSGRVLWERSDTRLERVAGLVRTGRGAERLLAALPGADQKDGGPASRVLTLLDPASGRVVSDTRLSDASRSFSTFSDRWVPGRVTVVDLEGDGRDEVVVDFNHFLYWPSFTVVCEAATGLSRVVFVASGHHRTAGAADVDGDGRKELLLVGINNRMGYSGAIAAVRASDAGSFVAGSPVHASTPDAPSFGHGARLLAWYALAPHRLHAVSTEPLRILPDARRIRWTPSVGAPWETDFDGFDVSVPSPLAGAARQEAREAAYADLRRSDVARATGDAGDAVASARRAAESALGAGDVVLAGWARRAAARFLVAAGRGDEAGEAFSRLRDGSDAPGEVCYDAGLAFHLAGDPVAAAAWFREGLRRQDQLAGLGRGAREFATGAFLALLEAERLDEASELLEMAAWMKDEVGLPVDSLRELVRLRRGERPRLPPAPPELDEDLHRAVDAEVRLHAGAPLEEVETTLAKERERTSITRPLLRTLEAELLARRGRRGEALSAAREAFEDLVRLRATETYARAWAIPAGERHARLAAAAGRAGEAGKARAEVARLRGEARESGGPQRMPRNVATERVSPSPVVPSSLSDTSSPEKK